MNFPINDPESLIYAQIVNLMKGSTNFNTLVKGKIESMVDNQFIRFKQEIQTADTPDIIIVPSVAQISLWGRNSLISEFKQTFRIVMVTDDLALPKYTLVKHVIIAIFSLAGCTLGMPGLIRNVVVKNAKDDAFGPKDMTRSTLRLMGILDIEVDYYLSDDAQRVLAQ